MKKNRAFAILVVALLTVVAFVLFAQDKPASDPAPRVVMSGETFSTEGMEIAVLAGGCFWGIEAVFERVTGVIDVKSGYSGGDASTAKYHQVGSGRTGHAEAVEIVFDPETVDYSTLLNVFFVVAHDPTQLNYQGPDHGTEYRSAIFYANEEQKQVATEFIRELERSGAYRDEIVTELNELTEFYDAEPYHQDFVLKNPGYPYVVYWDLPKIEHLEKEFPELISKR